MTISLMELQKLVSELFPRDHQSLTRILIAWARKDPGGELTTCLEGTGLDLQAITTVLTPLMGAPAEEDRHLLNRVILSDVQGPVTGWHLLNTLCDHPGHRITHAFVTAGLDLKALRRNLAARRPEPLTAGVAYLSDHKAETGLLARYGRDLTRLAREGAFDDLADRQADLGRLIEVLLKKNKGNGVLTGPAGVGKTALVESLAQHVARGRAPVPLQKMRLFEISMGKLLAGAIYRGQFEERLEKMLTALKACQPAILFIDEMHLIWGAGRAEGAPMDAANMLKPVLARGELRMIGATTVEEYRRYICRDEALARRFEEIRLEEPSGEVLMQMLMRQAAGLEQHHGITMDATLLHQAVVLTDQFLPNRRQPDKSIDLLDSSAVQAVQARRSTLTQSDLTETLARLTGLPIGLLHGAGRDRLRLLASDLKQRIIGQDQAMDKIAATLAFRRQIQEDSARNLGTFLFCGTTGVGKTETARILAERYSGDVRKLLHLDMAEYSRPDSVNKLIGAPDGYVGSEKQGRLAEFMNTHGHGVILCDEIEKAHSDLHHLFLGILDNGRIQSARGQTLDTRQSVIIFTTNAIAPEALKRPAMGFMNRQTPDPLELLTDHFPQEFLGRFDEIILFNSLTPPDLGRILNLRLEEARQRLAANNIHLEYDPERLAGHLLANLPVAKTGARGLARQIEQRLLQPIALAALASTRPAGPLRILLDEDYYRQGRITICNAPAGAVDSAAEHNIKEVS
jgi:ATP-dependent Clp protease ATP-binding subunit ClpA